MVTVMDVSDGNKGNEHHKVEGDNMWQVDKVANGSKASARKVRLGTIFPRG